MKTVPLFFAALVLSACGSDKKNDCSKGPDAALSGDDCKSDTKDVGAEDVDGFVLRGSVTSAFAVIVDGQDYGDMEEYFTAENSRLPSKVKDAGYEGYETRFDAAIGFKDLSVGMAVYVQPKGNRGYANRTIVARNDTFALVLPPEAAGDVYQVRAVKRIAVVLTKDQEVKRFCYNFSAVDLEVPYDAKDKPIVLDHFKSGLTTYECVQDPGISSLEIPENSDTPTPFDPNGTLGPDAGGPVAINDTYRGFLKPGLGSDPADEDKINSAFGSALLVSPITQGSNPSDAIGRWLYYQFDPSGGACESDANLYEAYDCRIMEGPSGVVAYENIRAEYLDPSATWPISLAEAYKDLGCGFVLATDIGPRCGKIEGALRGKLAPGVANPFGNGDGISPLGSHGEWQWFDFVEDGGYCASAEKVKDTHSCGLMLDAAHKIAFFKNIRSEYIDPAASWPTSESAAMTAIGCTVVQGANGPVCQ